jgi:riboflavin biosynthesis pyrimidine reductase
VLVEGGASTINHFFDHTFDEYIQITGIELGRNGLKAAQPKNVQLDSFETIDNNLIQYFKQQ